MAEHQDVLRTRDPSKRGPKGERPTGRPRVAIEIRVNGESPVWHATGVRVRDVPIRPEMLLG
jgi:hypothetical protein